MGATWNSVRDYLERRTRTAEAVRRYHAVSYEHPVLERFGEPSAAVDFLTSREGDLDEKDRVLRALVRVAQDGGDAGLARDILWLGLWPGLDAIYRRHRRYFASELPELVSALALAFDSLVHRLDVRRGSRTAATLVWGAERDLRKTYFGAAARWSRCVLEEPLRVAELRDAEIDSATHPRRAFAIEARELEAELRELVGRDAELVLRVLVLEECPRDAAAQVGLSHSAARKRLERAVARIRRELRCDLSHFACVPCV